MNYISNIPKENNVMFISFGFSTGAIIDTYHTNQEHRKFDVMFFECTFNHIEVHRIVFFFLL